MRHYSFKVHVKSSSVICISICLPHLDHGHLLSSSFPLLSLTCEALHPLPVRCFLILSILNHGYTFSFRSFTIFTLTIRPCECIRRQVTFVYGLLHHYQKLYLLHPKKAWPCLMSGSYLLSRLYFLLPSNFPLSPRSVM